MAKQLNVLFGFTSDKIQASISKEMVLRGFAVKGVKMTTKELIADYVKKHPEVDVVVLKEYLDGGGVYSPIELTKLVDDVRNMNVVIVLATNHRGKNEMRELYSAGILNAFFSDGKFGANPDKIAELACRGRTRKEARAYYRIDEIIPDHVNLTFEEFNDNYRYLLDNRHGMNMINRFVQISHMLYPGQLGAFIDRIPDDVKQLLMKYSEFYDIANKVYKLGYAKEKYKVPKGVKEGITKEAIAEELVKEKKRQSQHPEEKIVAAKSSGRTPKPEVEYDEPIGLERVEESAAGLPESAEMETVAEAPVKKGLFGKKKAPQKSKKKGKGEPEEENLFEQTSDVDFELEGVDAEPIADDEDSWNGAHVIDERIYAAGERTGQQAMAPREKPAPRKPSVEPPDYTKAAEIVSPVVDEAILDENSAFENGDNYDDMSLDELKKLLGN